MPTAVERFYIGLLSDPAAPRVLQRRIFDFASKRKSQTVFAALAAHPALDSRLDEQIGLLPYAKVKAAWAMRPSRPLEVLDDLAKNDSRAAVLVDLAGRSDLSDAAYEAMAKRKHLKVDWALLGNPRVPLELKREVARNLGSTLARDGWSIFSKLQAVLADQPELHDALASGSDNLRILELVADTPELSEATQDRISKVILEKVNSAVASMKGNQGGYHSSWGWNEMYQVSSLMQKFASNPGLSPTVALTLSDAISGVRTGNPSMDQTLATVVAALGAVKSSSGSKSNPLTKARTTGSVKELEKFAKTAVSAGNSTLAVAVVANPAAPAAVVAKVLSLVPYQALERLISARSSDLDVVTLLITAHPWNITDRLLLATGRPEEALVSVATFLGQQGRPLPPALLSSAFVTAEVARKLPLSTLAATDALPLALCKAATEALGDQFAGFSTRWEIFETLGDQFDGSLQELLDAVSLLAGDDLVEDMSDPSDSVSEEVSVEEVSVEEVSPALASASESPVGEAPVEQVVPVSATVTPGKRVRRASPAALGSGEQLALI